MNWLYLLVISPILTFLCVKFGTYAYFKTREKFIQENRNGEAKEERASRLR